jgi:hypothetical protein
MDGRSGVKITLECDKLHKLDVKALKSRNRSHKSFKRQALPRSSQMALSKAWKAFLGIRTDTGEMVSGLTLEKSSGAVK